MVDWHLDEVAHAGQEHLDPDYVADYERKGGYRPDADIEVLRGHGLGPDSLVVDMGAGPGTFALAVAPLCRQVIAVDVSPAMTALLRQRVAGAGLDNVTVIEAGFLSYKHNGEPADIVFTRNALHQVPDFWKGIALHRMAQLLKPGGILRLHDLAYDFEPGEAEDVVPAWFAGAVDDPAKGYTADELAEHVRLEHSTYSWLLDALLEHAGFTILERKYVRGAYGAYTCRRE